MNKKAAANIWAAIITIAILVILLLVIMSIFFPEGVFSKISNFFKDFAESTLNKIKGKGELKQVEQPPAEVIAAFDELVNAFKKGGGACLQKYDKQKIPKDFRGFYIEFRQYLDGLNIIIVNSKNGYVFNNEFIPNKIPCAVQGSDLTKYSEYIDLFLTGQNKVRLEGIKAKDSETTYGLLLNADEKHLCFLPAEKLMNNPSLGYCQ